MPSEVGLTCKFYRNTNIYGAPSWSLIESVRDLTLALDKALADISARSSDIRLQRSTLKEVPIEFTLVRHNTTAAKAEWKYFFDAWWSGSSVDVLALDGTTADTGASGVRGEYEVIGFSRGEPLEDAVTASVRLVPTVTSNGPPVKYEVV